MMMMRIKMTIQTQNGMNATATKMGTQSAFVVLVELLESTNATIVGKLVSAVGTAVGSKLNEGLEVVGSLVGSAVGAQM